jgi:hypothetical protein
MGCDPRVTSTNDGTVIEDYLSALVNQARESLGGNLIGAYLAGSLAFGAYQPGRSDIDVALVTADPLSWQQKDDLVQRLRHENLPCPARGLELVVYWRAVAGAGAPEPGFEVELNTGTAMPFRATYGGTERAAEDGLFWYGIDRSILREHGRELVGPPAHDVFGEVSRGDLRQLLIDGLHWYLAQPAPAGNEPDTGAADAVLGACRALSRIRTGYWLAKVPAGLRIAESGLGADVILQAVDARVHGGPAPGAADARAFQQQVLAEIAGC